MATTLEESENLKGERIATVSTKRGKEYLINVDKLAHLFAESLCDEANEKHFGWNLADDWYASERNSLLNALDTPNTGA